MLKLELSQKQIIPFITEDVNRPAMKGILVDITENKLVATNGHVLLKYSIELPDEFSENFILPLECFPKKQGNYTEVEKIENVLNVTEFKKYGMPIEKRLCEVINETFPNYKCVFPEKDEGVEVKYIGIDFSILKSICDFTKKPCKFSFYGRDKATIITPIQYENEFTILLMTVRYW